MPWVYILECSDKSFYTGSTWDLPHRFKEHADGKACAHTRRRRPVKLAWAQEFERIDDAYVVEHQIKGWSRQKKIALIEGTLELLPHLSSEGMTASRRPLTAGARRRVELNTVSIEEGRILEGHHAGFDPSPLDAVTKQTQRSWKPRSQRFSRLRNGAELVPEQSSPEV
ncbi:MAG: GIY-YIG nuclease family protein [Propionibacteriaceae bacterium]|nr:GIY-YIG nuclease family protein [Propionibacteriaceae bacterium]